MILLRAIFLGNEDVDGQFSDMSDALDNLKPEALREMADADVVLFNGVVVKNRFNQVMRAA